MKVGKNFSSACATFSGVKTKPCYDEQEAQLSQTGRVMLRVVKNIAKSLKIVQDHWKFYR